MLKLRLTNYGEEDQPVAEIETDAEKLKNEHYAKKILNALIEAVSRGSSAGPESSKTTIAGHEVETFEVRK